MAKKTIVFGDLYEKVGKKKVDVLTYIKHWRAEDIQIKYLHPSKRPKNRKVRVIVEIEE